MMSSLQMKLFFPAKLQSSISSHRMGWNVINRASIIFQSVSVPLFEVRIVCPWRASNPFFMADCIQLLSAGMWSFSRSALAGWIHLFRPAGAHLWLMMSLFAGRHYHTFQFSVQVCTHCSPARSLPEADLGLISSLTLREKWHMYSRRSMVAVLCLSGGLRSPTPGQVVRMEQVFGSNEEKTTNTRGRKQTTDEEDKQTNWTCEKGNV